MHHMTAVSVHFRISTDPHTCWPSVQLKYIKDLAIVKSMLGGYYIRPLTGEK